jgi:hypothetical protein
MRDTAINNNSHFLMSMLLSCLAVMSTSSWAAKPDKQMIKRGEYLITIGHCNDCHTPKKMGPNGPEPDMAHLLSGHPQDVQMPLAPKLAPNEAWNWAGAATLTAFSGPWGISYAHNLTPDKATGLGGWTEDQFDSALRTGKHLGDPAGRPILPPMPWQDTKALTKQDMHAMWVYLHSIPAIHNAAPDSVPTSAPASAQGH